MPWNYRVFRDRDGQYAIREVFYSDDGRLEGWTEEPVYPRAESLAGLRTELEHYAAAMEMPVLDLPSIERDG